MAATDLITLAEAKVGIPVVGVDAARDADLTTVYIPAATSVVEDLIGPVVRRAVTYVGDGGGAIVLPAGLSAAGDVTAVAESGVALAGGSWFVDADAGIVHRGTAAAPYGFTTGTQNVAVTYTAGIAADTASVPAAIKLAARIIVQHSYQADQQGNRPEFGAPDMGMVTTPRGFLIPNRAYQYLQRSGVPMIPGFA